MQAAMRGLFGALFLWAGLSGALAQSTLGGSVSSSAPTYDAGRNAPFSLDTKGNLRVGSVPAQVTLTATRITTSTNPQLILAANTSRRGYRVWNVSGATDGVVRATNVNTDPILFPLSFGGQALVGYETASLVGSTALWYHGAAGAVIDVVEGQ